MEKPIIDDVFVLKKGKEKGAWTFIEMPILTNVPKKRNSTVRVRGFIDDFELSGFNLWAMKKGTFMAVKADIRKAIKKEEGDSVKVVLYLDEPEMVLPDDFLVCLKEEPKLHKKFLSFDEKLKKQVVDWIFSATTDEEIVIRMGKIMDKLENQSDFKL